MNRQLPPEDKNSTVREWRSPIPTAGDAYALTLIAIFAVLFIAGIFALVRHPGSSFMAPLPGLAGSIVGIYVIWNPARKVILNQDGSFTFLRGKRQYQVTPGEPHT